jgi:hypothetical protein
MLTYLQNFCRFANLYSMPSGTISLLKVWTNSIPLNSKKSITELNGPHFTEIGILRILTLDLEIQQHLGSLKLVINIIIWIRDTGCYIYEGCCLEWCKNLFSDLEWSVALKSPATMSQQYNTSITTRRVMLQNTSTLNIMQLRRKSKIIPLVLST